ncbi:hypothetical protein NOR_06162 [Metarhizium rileyi]|uniref:Uncharacterized protein n=1 Tax=Metarhizium rileyi (strain RCEF 4871) TaxID=1649241 RepID=A0A167B7M5_METRR|nr:hypothetical protein NOR_06162 [Metarhizium rileyi RCEF 4871]
MAATDFRHLQPEPLGESPEAMILQHLPDFIATDHERSITVNEIATDPDHATEELATISTQDEHIRAQELSSRRRLRRSTTRAPAPRIPDPLNDDESFDSEEEDDKPVISEPIHVETKAPTCAERDSHHDSQHPLSPRLENEKQTLLKFEKIPAEIRLAIYEILLVSKSAIRVHSGWRHVFKRQSLGIPTSILRTCRDIYKEAIGVLYGRNTFLYILRDSVSTVTDVDRLAHIDETEVPFPINGNEDEDYDAEDEDDPDWRETSGQGTSRGQVSRHQSMRAPHTEGDIDVGKHLSLFRHLVVEAERNRSHEGTKKLMASALSIFQNPNMDNHEQVPNIHTLTVKVTPQWEPPETEEDTGYFTFVDFFNRDSPIMEVVRRVDCQFLCVDLAVFCRVGRAYCGCELKVDMRYSRITNAVRCKREDMWEGDEVMQVARQEKVSRALNTLATLDQKVAATCEKCLEHSWAGDDSDDEGVADGEGDDE